MSSFLQTTEWLEFQKSLGRRVFEYNQNGISAKVIKHNLPFGKSYLYIPHGPDIDFNLMTGGEKNPVRDFIKWLRETAKKEKAIFAKIEPLSDHTAQTFANPSAEGKFKKSKKHIQPSKTVVINLEKDQQVLLNSMHHKTRYNVKIAERREVIIEESDDIKAFWKLLKKTTKRDKFYSHPKDYYFKLLSFFENKSEIKIKLFLAKLEDKPIAGAIVLLHGDAGYYLHGASDYNYRSQMAPHLLHWQIINYLKNNSFKIYDLWGIDPKKWPGVTRFKLGWGGRVIEYPGSFNLPISKIWYLGYRLFRH